MKNTIEIFVIAIMLWLFVYKISKVLYNKEKVTNRFRCIFMIILCSVATTIINIVDFTYTNGIVKILLTYILFCVYHKIIFDKNWQKVLVSALILYICILVCEVTVAIIASLIMSRFDQNIEFLQNTIFINFVILLSAYILVNRFKKILVPFIINVKNGKLGNYIITFLILITIALLLYRIPINKWELTHEFVATMIILLVFMLTGLYLIKQRSDIEKTTSMYQQVVKHSNMTNKLLEDYRIVSHEHKNQLSIIRQMIKDDNSELIEYIDNLLSKRQDIKHKWIADLNKVPLDGLKGLINYKLLEAEDCNIELIINISDELNRFKNRLNKLSTIQKDELYSVVGVYLDNAIQATNETDNKNMSLDFYKDKNDMVLVIANTYEGNINIDKVDDYGYTTKGKNHGIGLHIVRKILEDNHLYSQSRKIVDNYYVQELRIHTGELKNKKSKK